MLGPDAVSAVTVLENRTGREYTTRARRYSEAGAEGGEPSQRDCSAPAT
jgi:hypothetical protein